MIHFSGKASGVLAARTTVLMVASAAVLSFVVAGCATSSQQDPGDAATASASATESQRPGAGTRTLPDAVPVVANAELAEQVKTFTDGETRGWSAVALTPTGTNATTVAAEINSTIKTAGWVTSVTGTDAEGLVVSATRTSGAQREWLNINVTTALPASGPAVTYRYGTTTAGNLKSSATSSPKSDPAATVRR